MEFITKHNYHEKRTPEERGEVNTLPSETVPNEARTIQEIMEAANAGIPPRETYVEFLDSEDLSKINRYFQPGKLDLTDIQKLNQDAKEMHDLIEKAKKKKEEVVEKSEEIEQEDLDSDGKIGKEGKGEK